MAPIISRNVSVDLHHNGMVIPKGSIVGGYVIAVFACIYFLYLLNLYYSYYLVAIGGMSRQPWINRPDDFIPERWEETAVQVPVC